MRKLAHAIALADEGSYVGAAALLNITQSALSRSIQTLEEGIGLRLFDRDRAGVRPTSGGKLLLERARFLMREARGLDELAAALAGGEAGEIRVGLGPLPASILLPSLLIDTLRTMSGITVTVAVQPATQLLADLEAERLDLFICSEHLIEPAASVTALRIARISTAILARAGHPLAGIARLSINELAPYPMISGRFPEHRPLSPDAPPITLTCEDFSSLRATTLATDAVWISSVQAARDELASGAMIVLDTVLPASSGVLTIALFRLRGRTPSTASQQVDRMIRSILAQRGG